MVVRSTVSAKWKRRLSQFFGKLFCHGHVGWLSKYLPQCQSFPPHVPFCFLEMDNVTLAAFPTG